MPPTTRLKEHLTPTLFTKRIPSPSSEHIYAKKGTNDQTAQAKSGEGPA